MDQAAATYRLTPATTRPLVAGLVVAGMVVAGAVFAVGPAIVAVALALLLWLRDPGPDSWRAPIYLLTCVLPVSTVLTLLLGAGAGEMGRVVAWSPLWREALIFATLALAVVAAASRPLALRAEDWCAVILAFLVIAYATLGLGSRGHELGLFQRALGARTWLLPIALYVLGRFAPVSDDGRARDLALVRRVTILVTLTAFVEFFLLGDRFWQQLHFVDFLRATATAESAIFRGVTYNYYTLDQQGLPIRRWPALMGTLTTGFWYLGALSVLFAGFWAQPRRRNLVLFLFATVALVGSRTRAAMGGLLIAAVCALLIRWRRERWIIAGAAGMLVILVALNARPTVARDVMSALRLPLDPSTLGHIAAIANGVQNVLGHPSGFGVGTAGYVAAGFASEGDTVVSESLYLSAAAELGWLGAALWITWIVVGALRLGRYALARGSRDDRWVLCTGLAVATIGYAIASVTTEVWRGLQAGALYWWLLGTAVSTATGAEDDG